MYVLLIEDIFVFSFLFYILFLVLGIRDKIGKIKYVLVWSLCLVRVKEKIIVRDLSYSLNLDKEDLLF